MPYSLRYAANAARDLARLDKSIAQAVRKKLDLLIHNVEIVPHHALSGAWRGFYRIRVGDYRVIYKLDHKNRFVIVEKIAHRSEIYDE
jgi:mRNA interferase RelE/StbE